MAADRSDALRGCKILIVDDEFLIAADIEYLFSDAGAEVAVTTTLPGALAAAAAQGLNAALLDLRLGNESSEPVADLLIERGIPFLFFSGQSLPEAMRQKFPRVRCLLKPVGFRDLLGAAAGLLGQSPA